MTELEGSWREPRDSLEARKTVAETRICNNIRLTAQGKPRRADSK